MNTQEKIEQIIEEYDRACAGEAKVTAYVLEKWPQLKTLIHAFWEESGHTGKPDPGVIDRTLGSYDQPLGAMLGDADLELADEKLWQERKSFNEDQINEFDFSSDPRGRIRKHLAVAECISELEGLEAALAYVDEWQQREPQAAFHDGARISLCLRKGRLAEARQIAGRYLEMPADEIPGDDLLLGRLAEVCRRLGDRERESLVVKRHIAVKEKEIADHEAAILRTLEVYCRKCVEKNEPHGIREIFDQLILMTGNEDDVYELMAVHVNLMNEDPELPAINEDGFEDAMLESLRVLVRGMGSSRKIRETGRCEKLEDLLCTLEDEQVRVATGIHGDHLQEAAARRLLSPGSMRNLFITMDDLTMADFRRVTEDPYAPLSEEEKVRLGRQMPLCVLLYDDMTVIPEDFKEQFRKLDTPAFEQQRKLFSWILSCLYMTDRCYGVLKDTEFLKMVSLNGTKLSIKEVKKVWQSLPADRKFCRFEGGYVFDSDFADGKEYIRQFAEIRRKYPLQLPTLQETEELYLYGWPDREPAYLKMKEYLMSLTHDTGDTGLLLIELFANVCAGCGIQEILTVFDDFENVQRDMDPKIISDLLLEIIRNTRNWKLAGHKPGELAPKKNALLRN